VRKKINKRYDVKSSIAKNLQKNGKKEKIIYINSDELLMLSCDEPIKQLQKKYLIQLPER
jgi:predicted AAA+ superfamily ATPase